MLPALSWGACLSPDCLLHPGLLPQTSALLPLLAFYDLGGSLVDPCYTSNIGILKTPGPTLFTTPNGLLTPRWTTLPPIPMR